METKLSESSCEPCEGGIPSLTQQEAEEYLERVDGWEYIEDEGVPKIEKQFNFKQFMDGIDFVNRMAEIAEQEGHHPNFRVDYNLVTVTIWTHAIDGLSENDFILAAKLNEVT